MAPVPGECRMIRSVVKESKIEVSNDSCSSITPADPRRCHDALLWQTDKIRWPLQAEVVEKGAKGFVTYP
jgi:hypothetical protein